MSLKNLCLALLCVVLPLQILALKLKSPDEAKGVLLLDSVTFNKLVPSPTFYHMILVANKHSIGDYGTDSIRSDFIAFAQFAQSHGENADEVLFSQVIVNGAENAKIARDLGLDDNFKHPALFIIPKDSTNHIQYPDNKPYHPHDLARFLAQYSTFYYHIPGTSKAFDRLSKDFIQTTDNTERANIVIKTKEALEKVLKEEEKDDLKYYVKVMEKVIEKGEDYLDQELDRLNNILKGSKLAKGSRNNIKSHVSVLQQFVVSRDSIRPRTQKKTEAEEF